jgi:two-component system, cell cycle sensor histidine kinase and response regulator CckA
MTSTDEPRPLGDDDAANSGADLYRSILHASPDVIVITDLEGRIRVISPSAGPKLGYASAEALVGRLLSELLVPADRERGDSALANRAAGAVSGTGEYRAVRADGTTVDIEANGDLVRDADGRPSGMVFIARDVTERRRMEAALRESEEKYRFLTENSQDVIWTMDLESRRFLYMSPSVTALRGYTVEEVLGQTLDEALSKESAAYVDLVIAEGLEAIAAGVLPEGTVIRTAEIEQMCKDGSTVWTEMSASYRRNPKNGRFEVYGVTRNITERRRAEVALRENEARSTALLRAMPDTMFLLSRDGVFLDHYAPDGDVLLARPEAFLGRHIVDVLPGEIAELTLKHIAEIERDGITLPYFYDVAQGDGVRSYESRMVACTGTTFLAIVRDVTERRRAEEERTRLEAQLRQAQKMESIGRLAGGVAHDFNNMLGVILGHAEIALEESGGHAVSEDLSEIRKAATRSAELTQQLLAFARKQAATPAVLDLNDAVAGTLKMLERLIGERVRLDWRPEAGLWSIRIDPSQIEQILTNLCVNARDAIADIGGIAIETANCAVGEESLGEHPGTAPGEYVRLTVKDDGCGMDEETLTYIFEPFFTTKPVGEGTGLGLATVYGIVQQNGGFIDVESAPGRGTAFAIHLPRHAARSAAVGQATALAPAERGRETILVVEDEPAVLNLTAQMLERLGYNAVAAGTPAEAIRAAREHRGEIHLLMTDVIMPEMNGRDLAKNLLSLYPNMRRLFMSGYTADVISHHGVLDEGVHFLQKPFTKSALAAKVRAALDG